MTDYNIILNTPNSNIFSKVLINNDKRLLNDVISAKYNNDNTDGMKETDIHHNFINYIIHIAQWHKKIDHPIENITTLKNIRQLINNTIDNSIIAKIKQLYTNNIDEILNNNKYKYIMKNKYHDRYFISKQLIDNNIVNDLYNDIFTNKLKNIINETSYIDKTKLHTIKSKLYSILENYNNNIVDKYIFYKSKNTLLNSTINNDTWLKSFKNSVTDSILMSLKQSLNINYHKNTTPQLIKTLRDDWDNLNSKYKKYYSDIISFIGDNDNYRLNMKKTHQNGGNITIFETKLPQINTTNRLWYIDENNKKQVVTFKDKNIIKNIYNQIYNSTDDTIKLTIDSKNINIGDTEYNTDINIDKVIKNRLYSTMKKSLSIKNKHINKLIDLNDIIKIDNNTRIYNCILNNDESKLKECFNKIKSDYKTYFINDIKTLNPYTIQRILQKFNFKTKNDNSSGKKIQNTKEWFDSNFDIKYKTDTDKLLLLYLNTMVDYVNNDTNKTIKLSNIDMLNNHRNNSFNTISNNNNGLVVVSDSNKILAYLLKDEIEKLKTKNRYITKEGLTYSSGLLYNFHNKELQLKHTSLLIHDYTKLLNIFGNNYTSTLKQKYLNDLTNKYNKLFNEYKIIENNIMNLIRSISKY